MDGRFYRLTARTPAGERALELSRTELDELFAEWAARGHVPLVDFAQPHETDPSTLILDLSAPDEEEPIEPHSGRPSLVSLEREVPGLGPFVLEFLVTDRVKESELEPILQRVAEVLSRVGGHLAGG